MHSVGIDIIEILRFEKANYPERLAEFFLTPAEFNLMPRGSHNPQYLASRFAAKEAFIKAIPESSISYHDFEIVKYGQRPGIKYLKSALNKYKVALSLAHSEHSAVAIAVVEY